MYCPNCSTEASAEQKFCRSCGMELQAVAELISGQANIAKPEKSKEVQRSQRAMLIWGMCMTFGGVAAGSSLKVLGREHIQVAGEFTPYLMVLALLICFAGMGLMCYPFLQGKSGKPRSQKTTAPTSEPTIRLSPELLAEEQPTVTEHTTAFLESSEARIKVRDTAPHND